MKGESRQRLRRRARRALLQVLYEVDASGHPLEDSLRWVLEHPSLDEEGDQGFMRIDGDFNADGAGDLALLDFSGLLRVHPSRVVGVDSMQVKLSPTPLFQAEVGTPQEVRTVDLDGDGRSDFALRYADSVVPLVNEP